MELLFTEPSRTIILALVVLWTLPWKGYALWLSARAGHKWWFVALLVLNTLAILEIIYIFTIGRKANRPETKQGVEGQ